MTLPTNINLPISSEDVYLRELTYSLSTYIQQTNFECNGTYQTFTQDDNYPFIVGSTASGSATYTNTILFSQRSNLTNRIWFDISWSSHTGTGNLTITLPYSAQFISQIPFVGAIESNGLTFTAGYTYLVGNVAPNTNLLTVRQCGSGLSSIPLTIPAAGSLRGSIIYAGQQFS